MNKIQLQKKGTTLVPFSPEDALKLAEYRDNQILRADVRGVKKPRSLIQLRQFWAICRSVASNTDDINWNTPEKVAFQVKVKLRYFRHIIVIDGAVQFEPDSISFERMSHLEACNFFDRAYVEMAGFLGCTVDELKSSLNDVD